MSHPNAPITCQDSVSLVSLLRDQDINDAQQRQLHAHVSNCPRCQVAQAQFEAMFVALDHLFGHTQQARKP